MRALVLAVLIGATAVVQGAERRPIAIDDQFRFVGVADPQLSPDGEWVLYTVSGTDVAADRRNTELWKVRYDGSACVQLCVNASATTSPPRTMPPHVTVSLMEASRAPAVRVRAPSRVLRPGVRR